MARDGAAERGLDRLHEACCVRETSAATTAVAAVTEADDRQREWILRAGQDAESGRVPVGEQVLEVLLDCEPECDDEGQPPPHSCEALRVGPRCPWGPPQGRSRGGAAGAAGPSSRSRRAAPRRPAPGWPPSSTRGRRCAAPRRAAGPARAGRGRSRHARRTARARRAPRRRAGCGARERWRAASRQFIRYRAHAMCARAHADSP